MQNFLNTAQNFIMIKDMSNLIDFRLINEEFDYLDFENNPTYVDYTPYIEAHNIRQLIDDIQHTLKNPNATKEENNTAEQPIENEGIV